MGAEYLLSFAQIPDGGQLSPMGEEHGVVGYANATVGAILALSAGVQFSDNSTEKFDRPPARKNAARPSWRAIFPSLRLLCGRGGDLGRPVGRGAEWDTVQVADANETGFVLNGAVGYRLPNNRGLLSLEVENLLDNDLSLQISREFRKAFNTAASGGAEHYRPHDRIFLTWEEEREDACGPIKG